MIEIAEPRRIKAFTPLTFKAAGEAFDGGTLKDGEFVALAAVFGNIDSYGDRLVKGCFEETLGEWAASGNTMSVIYSHQWADPLSNIGAVLDIRETEEGLLYKGLADLDDPVSRKVYNLMKGRRITQQSFGFDILDAREVIEDEKYVFEITKAHLFEVGPCLVGVNRATDLLDIKSGGVAPGRGAAEPHRGQATPAGGASSVTPGSNPEAPPSKSILDPASVKLALEIMELEGVN